MQQAQFLVRLQEEAALQARLHHRRLLPSQLDFVTSFIGKYSWQVLVVLSGLAAVLWEIGDPFR